MKSAIFVLCVQCILFYCQYDVAYAQPLIGHNIRAATDHEYPGVVSIQLVCATQTPVEQHVCTGTLISTEDVITAEHCLSDANDYNAVQISMGTADLNRNRIAHVAWWITFVTWAYQRNKPIRHAENDIAVIRLTEKVDNTITPAVISFVTTKDLGNKEVFMAGWGKLTNGTTSPIMQTAQLNVLQRNECNHRLSILRQQPSTAEVIFVCTAANPYVIMGKGDSGGPLFYDDYVVAVNKAIGPNLENVNRENKINFHINLIYYKQFILFVRFNM